MGVVPASSFVMSRPRLHDYAARTVGGLTVETYRSEPGEMLSQPAWHRITLNRSSHRRYAHRFGDHGPLMAVRRPRNTLGFEPAGVSLFVDGDDADYLSIFQDPALYRSAAQHTGGPDGLVDRPMLAEPDPLTLQLLGALAALTSPRVGQDAMLVEHLGTSLALCVLRLLQERPGDRRVASARLGNVPLRRVIDYIEANLGNAALSIAELAAIAGTSPFHFARAFRASLGCPPHRFLVERRVERAKVLLREQHLPLAEVAVQVGFSDQAHLCSVFRRETGTSPGRFRADR
jgi:AraC family transcriptional regulator